MRQFNNPMEDDGGKWLAFIFIVVLSILVFTLGPYCLIWAVSKLWNVSACYDGWHWLAGFTVIALLRGGTQNKK